MVGKTMRSTPPPSPADKEVDSVNNQLAALLADVHVGLAIASTQQEFLIAVMRYVERYQPLSAHLHCLHTDPTGRPVAAEIAAVWSGGQVPPNDPTYGTRFELAQFASSELWIHNPHDLVMLEDLESDPRCDPELREVCRKAGQRAMVILPLFSIAHSSWQGVLSVCWAEPHVLSSEERFVYSMLMATLSSFLANQRSDQTLRAALTQRQEQSALLTTVLEHLPMGVAMVDAATLEPRLANRMAVHLLGRGIEPTPTRDTHAALFRCLRPGTHAEIPQDEMPVVRALRTQKLQTDEVEVLGDDGQRRTLDCTAAPISDESGLVRNAVILVMDVTQRKRAESEQLRIQQELINVQAAALAERSTPLIPISDEIVILPLIGSLDAERGNQLLDTLLHGVSQNRSRVAIIDVTGVKFLDTQAASTLTGAAQALRLLGVEPILTGIRAEVAQTLITLGVRLSGIATRNNLQSGIALALKYTAKKTLS